MNGTKEGRTLALMAVVTLAVGAAVADLTIDFSRESGKIRRLNGICNTARINTCEFERNDALPDFRELELPCARFHDAPLENPGYGLVDVSRIFPLMHLDANDPRNYRFQPTDDYLKRALETGAEIEFRIGESIEHSKNHYRIHPPADLAKYADVCLHIIRHYNEGWADGHHMNIRRWSIWEEPNLSGRQTLHCERGKQLETYGRLYAAVARAIKGAYPDLLVGGPQDTGNNAQFRWDFLKYCRDNSLPLDFVMFDDYSRSPEDLLKKVVDTRAKMDEYGFRKARLGVAEWHYGPEGWDRVSSADLTGVDSGVYASAVLSRLHDSPVDDMFYYSATLGYWGLVAGRTRRPAWHAFKAFQQLAAKGEAVRVDVPSFPEAGRYALAAKHGGKGHAMLSSFKRGDDWKLTVKGAKPVSVKRLDNALKLETTKAWKWNAGTGALTLVAPAGSTSALWLVEFDL